MKRVCGILAFLIAGTSGIAVRANTVTYTTLAGHDGDGNLAATVAFTTTDTGLKIVVTNTETDNLAKGQAISGFFFTLTNGSVLSVPTAFSSLSGSASTHVLSASTWSAADGGPTFTDTPAGGTPNAIDHWGFAVSSKTVTLATAGSSVSGATGNPHWMIIPTSGTTQGGSSLDNGNFDPFIIGPGTFLLAVPGISHLTSISGSDFSSVSVEFGTGPDQTLGTNGTPVITNIPPVPVPAAAWSGLSLLAGLAAYRKLRRR
jgi:hypothetical protein